MPPQITDNNDESLALEHQRLRSLVNSMADAVIAVDTDFKIVLYNAAALEILDVNNIETGSPISSIFRPIDNNNQPLSVEDLIRGASRPTTTRDLKLKYDDESVINLYVSIAPVRLSYGEQGHGGYVLLLRDITREKSLEEERDEFISVVSHELRTPITISEGNISNAQLMLKSNDMESIKKALDESHNQMIFLADMINDLSTLSRAERGRLEVDVEVIEIPAFVSELVDNYRPQAESKGLQLAVELDPSAQTLKSSRLYTREILQNFITNAIKYSERGQVTIKVHGDNRGITFNVIDTGIGISKADQERVFDKFFRSQDYRTSQAKGTGLGLYVTMKLARLIHAEIDLQSELNLGSTFSIFIPNLE